MADFTNLAQIRVSSGTEITLGLRKGSLDVEPTTAYLLTYHPHRCTANCSFCTQARESTSDPNLLSRVSWLPHPLPTVIEALANVEKGRVKRVCIQTVNYPHVIYDVADAVSAIKERASLPVSISCSPLEEAELDRLLEVGVERICIPIDASTEEIFDRVKGARVGNTFTRSQGLTALKAALKRFGKGRVGSYIMVGLGETEQAAVSSIQELKDLDVHCSLFAFTPVSGSPMENQPKPALDAYRRIQLACFLIGAGIVEYEQISFKDGILSDYGVEEEVLKSVIASGKPFQTRGCPDCNRPYYNESPREVLYNYHRSLTPKEIHAAEAILKPILQR